MTILIGALVISPYKYVYTLNNPYKYVDRNGNWSLFGVVGNIVKKVVNTVVKAVTKVVKTVVNVTIGTFSPSTAKNINKVINNVSNKVTSFVDSVGRSSTSNKGGGSSKVKKSVKKVEPKAKCPEIDRASIDGKTVYSFTEAAEYSNLVTSAKSQALNAIAGIDKRKAEDRAEKAMIFYDKALANFKNKISYNMKSKIIKIDYLVTAILDVAVKIVKEYNEPKVVGTTQIQTASMSSPQIYKIYSSPNTIDKNKMYYNLVQTSRPYDIKNRDGWTEKSLGQFMLDGAKRNNDYLGNYVFGVIGKEMFDDINIQLFGYNLGTDSYLVNAAGLAQQWHNGGKLNGTLNWLWIRVSSGFTNSGDNDNDSTMIQDGIRRWYRDYGK